MPGPQPGWLDYIAAQSGAQPPIQQPAYRTMYHGTRADYERMDPAQFDAYALYGPGLYTTSDPRIAQSYAKYGETDTQMAFLQKLQDDWDHYQQQAANPQNSQSLNDRYTEMAQLAEQRLSGTKTTGNIRPVNIPEEGLNLLDVRLPLRPDEIAKLNSAIGYEGFMEGDLGQTVWDLFRSRPGWSGDDAAHAIQQLGWEGIAHTGGLRNALKNPDGSDMTHEVNLIYENGLSKVKNKYSGGIGGSTPVDPKWLPNESDKGADWMPIQTGGHAPSPPINLPDQWINTGPGPGAKGHIQSPPIKLPDQTDQGADWVPQWLRSLFP